jgi:hypothetical protein
VDGDIVDDSSDWFRDLPDPWEYPEELRSPTKYPYMNLSVILMGSGLLNHDAIELHGRYLIEHSLLMTEFAKRTPTRSFRQSMLLVHLRSNGLKLIYGSWLEYERAFRSTAGLVGTYENEYAALVEALRTAVEELHSERMHPTL